MSGIVVPCAAREEARRAPHPARATAATEVFSLDDAPRAYEKLHAGLLRGRAVVVPE